MKELLEVIYALKDKAAVAGDETAARFDIDRDSLPVAALNMLHNHLIMCIELIEHYGNCFPKEMKNDFENRLSAHPQEAERIVALFSSCFVWMLSSFEFCAKEVLPSLEAHYGKPKGRVYFGGVMIKSHELGWISEKDSDAWAVLVELRNTLVHNNAKSDKDLVATLPNGVVWKFSKGNKIITTLRQIPATIEWAIDGYVAWCESVIPLRKAG